MFQNLQRSRCVHLCSDPGRFSGLRNVPVDARFLGQAIVKSSHLQSDWFIYSDHLLHLLRLHTGKKEKVTGIVRALEPVGTSTADPQSLEDGQETDVDTRILDFNCYHPRCYGIDLSGCPNVDIAKSEIG